jgi:hypothetical protein
MNTQWTPGLVVHHSKNHTAGQTRFSVYFKLHFGFSILAISVAACLTVGLVLGRANTVVVGSNYSTAGMFEMIFITTSNSIHNHKPLVRSGFADNTQLRFEISGSLQEIAHLSI